MSLVEKLTAVVGIRTRSFERGMDRVRKHAQKGSGEVEKTTKKASRGLRDMGLQSERTEGRIKRLVTSLGRLHLAVGGIRDISRGIKGLIAPMTAAQARFETFKIGLTTLMKSADAAEKHIMALEEFAAKTPFEEKELQGYNNMLAAMQFRFEEIIPTLTVVGDAVAALGGGADRIGNITWALGQMKAQGRMTGYQVRMLAMSQIPIYEILQKKLKLTSEEMKRVAEAGIDADTAISAILSGLSEKYGGLMGKLSQTTTGLLSNIEDVTDQIKRRIGQIFEPGTKSWLRFKLDSLEKFKGWLDRNLPMLQQKFKQTWEFAARIMKWAWENGGQAAEKVWAWLKGSFWPWMIEQLEAFATKAAAALDALLSLAQTLKDLREKGAVGMLLGEGKGQSKYPGGDHPYVPMTWGGDGSMNIDPKYLTASERIKAMIAGWKKSMRDLPGLGELNLSDAPLASVDKAQQQRWAETLQSGLALREVAKWMEKVFAVRTKKTQEGLARELKAHRKYAEKLRDIQAQARNWLVGYNAQLSEIRQSGMTGELARNRERLRHARWLETHARGVSGQERRDVLGRAASVYSQFAIDAGMSAGDRKKAYAEYKRLMQLQRADMAREEADVQGKINKAGNLIAKMRAELAKLYETAHEKLRIEVDPSLKSQVEQVKELRKQLQASAKEAVKLGVSLPPALTKSSAPGAPASPAPSSAGGQAPGVSRPTMGDVVININEKIDRQTLRAVVLPELEKALKRRGTAFAMRAG